MISKTFAIALALTGLHATTAAAQLPICSTLKLYGWGKSAGTFIALNLPETKNAASVAEIQQQPQDEHLTFYPSNAADSLHLTITGPNNCKARNDVGGTFPGHLTFQHNNAMCGVAPAPILANLNAVQDGGTCKAAFTNANSGLSEAQKTYYVDLCKSNACP